MPSFISESVAVRIFSKMLYKYKTRKIS